MSRLIIIGASARAAAASAIRAGFTPWCADLFADSDLRQLAPHTLRCSIENYPKGFLELLRDVPDTPWMYTGALENHPKLIRKIADVRPLWGNGPKSLLACRSPFNVQRILREAGLPALELLESIDQLPKSEKIETLSPRAEVAHHSDLVIRKHCRWLRKPLAGSAGQGIAFVEQPGETTNCYLQQYMEGIPMSAVYARVRGQVRLLGLTEQLIAQGWLNACAFRYAGNIGPIEMDAELRRDLMRVGSVLGEECDLLGLFGVDFILAEGRPWVVEVNPRYTASIEVIELAGGPSSIAEHASAFGITAVVTGHESWGPIVGKGIVYATQKTIFNGLANSSDSDIRFADVPDSGATIEESWPIMSVLVRGTTRDECLERLRGAARRVLRP